MQLAPNDKLTVKRLVSDVDGHKTCTNTVYENLSCYTEPIQDEFALGGFDQNSVYPKKAYDFGGVYDIRIGDIVIDQKGVTFMVKGVRIFEDNLYVFNDIELLIAKEAQ